MLLLSCLSRQWESHQACLISLIQVLSFCNEDKRIGRVSDDPLRWFCPASALKDTYKDGQNLWLLHRETVFPERDQHYITPSAFRAESNIWILARALT